MWGANKWTNYMFKKYWYFIVVFIIIYIGAKVFKP